MISGVHVEFYKQAPIKNEWIYSNELAPRPPEGSIYANFSRDHTMMKRKCKGRNLAPDAFLPNDLAYTSKHTFIAEPAMNSRALSLMSNNQGSRIDKPRWALVSSTLH